MTIDPNSREFQDEMSSLAQFLDEKLNPERKDKKLRYVFAFLLFEFGETQNQCLVANVPRKEVVKLLKQFIAHQEARYQKVKSTRPM